MSISVETIQSGTGIDVNAIGKNASPGGSSEGSFIGVLMQIFGATAMPEDVIPGVKTGLISADGKLTEEGAQVLSDVEASLLAGIGQPAANATTESGMTSMRSALSRITSGLSISITGETSESDAPEQNAPALTDQTIKDDLSLDPAQSVLVGPAAGPTMSSATVASDNEGNIQGTFISAETNAGTTAPTSPRESQTATGSTFPERSLASSDFNMASTATPATGKNEESAGTQDKTPDVNSNRASGESETAPPAKRTWPETVIPLTGRDRTQAPPQPFPVNDTPTDHPVAGSAETSGTAAVEPSQLMAAAADRRAVSEANSKAVGSGRIIALQVEKGEQTAQSAGVSAAATALSLTGAAAKAGVKIETVQQAVAAEEDPVGAGTTGKTAESATASVRAGENAALKNSKKSLSDVTIEAPDRSSSEALTTADRDKKTGSIKTESAPAVRHGDQTGTTGNVSAVTSKTVEGGDVQPQAVIRQVVDGAASSIGKESGRIRIELTPPSLGTLNLDLVVTQDRVKMVILADNQDVRNLLQSNMEQLKTSLQQQGIKTDAINVFVQDRFLSNGNPGGSWGGQQAWHFQGQMQDGSDSGNAFARGNQEAALEGDTDDPLSNPSWRVGGSGVHIVA